MLENTAGFLVELRELGGFEFHILSLAALLALTLTVSRLCGKTNAMRVGLSFFFSFSFKSHIYTVVGKKLTIICCFLLTQAARTKLRDKERLNQQNVFSCNILESNKLFTFGFMSDSKDGG